MVINPIVGVYIPSIRIPIKGGMTIPNKTRLLTMAHMNGIDSLYQLVLAGFLVAINKKPAMHRGLRDVLNDPKHSAALATHKALDLMGGPQNGRGGLNLERGYMIYYIDIIKWFEWFKLFVLMIFFSCGWFWCDGFKFILFQLDQFHCFSSLIRCSDIKCWWRWMNIPSRTTR